MSDLVPVTVENFVRAETDAYFKKYAIGKGRELGSVTLAVMSRVRPRRWSRDDHTS